jgi:hypothetical protein
MRLSLHPLRHERIAARDAAGVRRAVAIALALGVLASAGVALAEGGGHATRGREFARICFPAASWDAPDHERPCYRVSRPYEDGSGELAIRADTIRSSCTIPNVYEEPARFEIECVSRGGRR